MPEINRRDFVTMAAAACAGACMLCDGLGGTAIAAEPTAAEAGGTKVDAGALADYAKDGVYDKLADSKKVIIVREGTKIYAMTSICTHKMGVVKIKGSELVCPKHNSHFANDGKPKSGPAKAALFHLGISQTADGKIMVDTSKRFGEKQWDDAGASITVKA